MLLAVLLNVAAAPPVLTSGTTPRWRLHPSQVATVARLGQRPKPTAKAALLVDVDTKTILYERQMTLRLPQASTTKIMTAVLALEQGRLDDRVTVPANLEADGSLMGLQPGETLTLKELLYGLLLPSGNDAALVIAQHISGSVESFVAAMNAKAQALGLADTHFENPHGHDSPNHYTSARDLWFLATYALENPVFAEIVSTPAAKVAGRDLVNRNEMLVGYPDVDGVKTGTTDLAGECLVVTVRRDGHRALAVVLGSNDRYADARALLDYYYTNYGWRTLQLPGNALERVRDNRGQVYRLRLASASDAFLPRWQWPLLQPIVTLVTGKQATPGGIVRFRAGPFILDDLPVTGELP
ncbi:MAG: D-alanyl-D-alanine carboxypeptidase [Anaerolineae bacterium]|nr:D-alanyl-D-alanine carboxypeptidase [Anaerolineae bacterium]